MNENLTQEVSDLSENDYIADRHHTIETICRPIIINESIFDSRESYESNAHVPHNTLTFIYNYLTRYKDLFDLTPEESKNILEYLSHKCNLDPIIEEPEDEDVQENRENRENRETQESQETQETQEKRENREADMKEHEQKVHNFINNSINIEEIKETSYPTLYANNEILKKKILEMSQEREDEKKDEKKDEIITNSPDVLDQYYDNIEANSKRFYTLPYTTSQSDMTNDEKEAIRVANLIRTVLSSKKSDLHLKKAKIACFCQKNNIQLDLKYFETLDSHGKKIFHDEFIDEIYNSIITMEAVLSTSSQMSVFIIKIIFCIIEKIGDGLGYTKLKNLSTSINVSQFPHTIKNIDEYVGTKSNTKLLAIFEIVMHIVTFAIQKTDIDEKEKEILKREKILKEQEEAFKKSTAH